VTKVASLQLYATKLMDNNDGGEMAGRTAKGSHPCPVSSAVMSIGQSSLPLPISHISHISQSTDSFFQRVQLTIPLSRRLALMVSAKLSPRLRRRQIL
jgi:hypothetical protein